MKIWEFDSITYGETLKCLRLDKNLSQAELAEMTRHCKVSTIKNYEQYAAMPTVRGLLEIAKALGVDEIRIDTSKGGFFY